MKNVSFNKMKMSSWVFKNAAGYHPGLVTPSATDGAPLTHDYESHGFKSCRYKFFFMIPCFSNLLGELGSIRHKHWFRWQHLSPMKGHIHDKCCHLQVDGAALEEENNSPSWASESRSGLLNLRFSIILCISQISHYIRIWSLFFSLSYIIRHLKHEYASNGHFTSE